MPTETPTDMLARVERLAKHLEDTSLPDSIARSQATALRYVLGLLETRQEAIDGLRKAMHDIEHPEPIHPRSRHTLSLATQQMLRELLAKCEPKGDGR